MISERVSTKQQQIANNAKKLPEVSFTSLSYHIDVEWLRIAYENVRKDGAPGIDGKTRDDYSRGLKENLQNLLNMIKSGEYKAPPVKRVYIPKNKTEKRPIGIPTFEDKVAQKVVQMVLEPLYEQDFYNFSYGFRKGKSQHMALNRLRKETMDMKGAYIIDLDISKYFDTLVHKLLREILQKRVRDGVIIRMIGKWLKAGVMEGKKLFKTKAGSPQGGIISPILSNVYLHEVLDKWFVQQVKPRLKGKAEMVRYADDAVLIFQYEEDLQKVLKVLPKRFDKFGLKMNAKKTQVVNFKRPNLNGRNRTDKFTFLSFTHYWSKSRKGNWVVKRKTDKNRLSKALSKIVEWCSRNRHKPIKEQQMELNRKLIGHYNYFGITPNSKSIALFWENTKRIWMKWLNRRSRTRHLNWEKFNKLLAKYPLAPPRIYHSFI